jgi:hypothetical protein
VCEQRKGAAPWAIPTEERPRASIAAPPFGDPIMPRKLTVGEKTLLRSVFGPTLPYDDQDLDINYEQYGGPDNSITFAIVPHMAAGIWSLDYSLSSVSDNARRTFIHEMGHVWNWYHGGSNIRSFIWTGLKMKVTGRHYNDAYFYDLSESDRLSSYNFEEQASIIADYWYVLKGYPPKYNTGSKKSVADYRPFILQVQTSGPPASASHTKAYAERPDSRPL